MASSIGSVSCLVDSAKITRRFARSFFETTNSLIVWPLLSLSFRSILEQFFDRPPIADPSRPLPLELTHSADVAVCEAIDSGARFYVRVRPLRTNTMRTMRMIPPMPIPP